MNQLDMQVFQFYFPIIISGGQFLLKTPLFRILSFDRSFVFLQNRVVLTFFAMRLKLYTNLREVFT